MRSLWILASIAACSGDKAERCQARAVELERYLASVWDLKQTVKPPWPTGDVETDKLVQAARDELRAATTPNPDHKATQLAMGTRPGPLDVELAHCAPAAASLARVGLADTAAEKVGAFTGIANAIGQCGCNVNMPLVRASLYFLARGAD